MDRDEHLYIKLMEECDEVSQRVSKLMQFGADEVQEGQLENNAQRLRYEVNDFLSVVLLLEQFGLLPREKNFLAHFVQKREKILKYRELSESLDKVSDKGILFF